MTDKPQLHVSMLNSLSKCGIQFQRRYGARFGVWDSEEIIPPSIALNVGSSVHKAVEKTLRAKMDEGKPLNDEAVAEIARDSFDGYWGQGVLLTDKEAENREKSKGVGLDQSVNLAVLHNRICQPVINPLAVEEKFVIKLKDYPIDLSGAKDVVEKYSIGDTKTVGKTPPENAARSLQLAMYSLDYKIKHGKLPMMVYNDYLVKNITPKHVRRTTQPKDSWITPLFRRIERFVEIIEAVKMGKQAFTPANPDDWICEKKYCGYSLTCPFWSGR